ncbi:phosphoenolpyruvate-utilizing N-terminal domain-containing protein [Pallidibacillus pasinlerensis]|uniref:Phosphoenolpyruvate-protein phosphotransferase n=1 Tax=Pallidibacillus pasinlerensis TaxID=2703818 RepID=A0ABX0A2P6_9BACI|nr:phosphoenolpyruvate-utilizing N-terminal domain-containing protein [Pallidibacillus pasinlerensis]NCU17102.1 hypothetical protein [Pallidibacillus pasinlerensis]
MSTWIKGIPTSEKIVIGKAYCVKKRRVDYTKRIVTDTDEQVKRLFVSINEAIQFVKNVQEYIQTFFDEEKPIYEDLLLLFQNRELIDSIKQVIEVDHVNAEFAIQEVMETFSHLKDEVDVTFLQEAENILLACLENKPILNHSLIMEEVILVTEDFSPIVASQFNRKYCIGIVTDYDFQFSNVSLFSQSLHIPAIIGTNCATTEILNGDLLILDGETGQVHINPTEELLNQYKSK